MKERNGLGLLNDLLNGTIKGKQFIMLPKEVLLASQAQH
jgi:hypothetical protein